MDALLGYGSSSSSDASSSEADSSSIDSQQDVQSHIASSDARSKSQTLKRPATADVDADHGNTEPVNKCPKKIQGHSCHAQQHGNRHGLVLPSAGLLLDGDEEGLEGLQEVVAGPAHLQRLPPAPSLPDHLGRLRTFPHVEGDYPTIVMIPVEFPPTFKQQLYSVVAQLRERLGLDTPLHISYEEEGPEVHVAGGAGSAAVQQQVAPAHHSREHPTGTQTASDHSSFSISSQSSNQSNQNTGSSTVNNHSGPGGSRGAGIRVKGGAARAVLPATSRLSHHVSLSRTLPVKFHLVPTLLPELREKLAGSRRFELELGGLECFINDERTRTFLSVPLWRKRGLGQARGLIAAVNQAFIMHGLQPFYVDAQPHVSVAWLAGDQLEPLRQAVQELQQARGQQQQQQGQGQDAEVLLHHVLEVVQVVCRVGQRNHVVWSAQ
mmetsp:Transcript_9622/g.20509  ORF Transcript_9622/g.20509 Transcript_9622/m.20509 type:complete len:436 (+) Transcript_9622:2-1309(+)